MELAGFLLLVSGWAIVLAAAALLKTVPLETLFVLAGVATEVVGLVLVIRTHLAERPARG
ncbi:MAG TPA: hypothetical protein VN893_00250 [Bryobacteraceae bacterium]|nr:hypothetical protein [Bryobacteraceae bacterium]